MKLHKMTWEQVAQEMSIAGDPDKIAKLGQQIMQLIAESHDKTNRAELTNIEFMLKRVIAEIRLYQRMYDNSH
jgi:hypothetical protein